MSKKIYIFFQKHCFKNLIDFPIIYNPYNNMLLGHLRNYFLAYFNIQNTNLQNSKYFNILCDKQFYQLNQQLSQKDVEASNRYKIIPLLSKTYND